MKHLSFLNLAIAAMLLLAACQKEGPAGATGAAGPAGPQGPIGLTGPTDSVLPRMYAWGIIDSFGVILSGSENFTVTWDATNHWYRVGFSSPFTYYKDSALILITPVGNGSWDQMASVGELIEASARLASVKFTDASRLDAGFNTLDARRRSSFNFALYDLRTAP